MADKGVENRDPSSGPSGRPRDDETNESGRASNRRRIMIASLLTPPAVMTLNARSARAQASTHPSMNPNYGKNKHKGKGNS